MLKIFNSDSKFWSFYSPMILLAVGVLIRGWTYVQGQCLWQDEAVWANGILDRSLIDILTAAKGYVIQMPCGLGAVIKIFVDCWGGHEYVWRFIPFLCSVGALIAYDCLLRSISGPFVRNFALALMAVLSLPVYYASELRAYSVDVFGFLVLFYCCLNMLENPGSLRPWYSLLIVGLLMPWFSFAPIFILPAIIGVLGWYFWRYSVKFSLPMFVSTALIWAGNFYILYFLFYKKIDGSQYYKEVFQNYFFPYPLTWQSIVWLFERTKFLVYSAGFELPLLPLMIAAFGFYAVSRSSRGSLVFYRRRFALQLSCVVVLLVLTAAACHKFPLLPRALLFLAPVFLWGLAEGVHALCISPLRWIKPCAVLIMTGLLLTSAFRTWHEHLWVKPDMKSVIRLIGREEKPGDRLILVEASTYAFAFYYRCFLPRLALSKWAVFTFPLKSSDGSDFLGIEYRDSLGVLYQEGTIEWLRNDRKDIDSFKKLLPAGRMWVLFSDSMNSESFLLSQLDQYGKKIKQWKDYRTALYLYELP